MSDMGQQPSDFRRGMPPGAGRLLHAEERDGGTWYVYGYDPPPLPSYAPFRHSAWLMKQAVREIEAALASADPGAQALAIREQEPERFRAGVALPAPVAIAYVCGPDGGVTFQDYDPAPSRRRSVAHVTEDRLPAEGLEDPFQCVLLNSPKMLLAGAQASIDTIRMYLPERVLLDGDVVASRLAYAAKREPGFFAGPEGVGYVFLYYFARWAQRPGFCMDRARRRRTISRRQR